MRPFCFFDAIEAQPHARFPCWHWTGNSISFLPWHTQDDLLEIHIRNAVSIELVYATARLRVRRNSSMPFVPERPEQDASNNEGD